MLNGNGSGNCLRYECVERLGIRNICTYLGSNLGDEDSFTIIGQKWAAILVANHIRLVCGGLGRGLMQIVGEEMLRLGGDVTAVTPVDLLNTEGKSNKITWQIDATVMGDFDKFVQEFLSELTQRGGSVQIVVRDMGIRKRLMYLFSDAFAALPGGIGTLEEVVEQLTWRQLGHHKKPIGILNHVGFYDPLFELFHNMRGRSLITEAQPIEYGVAHDIETLLPVMCGELESKGRFFKRPLMRELFAVTGNDHSTSQL